ncbi:MAG: hypothetical protein HY574_08150 [candidate division NC10 bacterium]|nr:hypothetical protein [candidate division NC10 bacterium]
MRVAKLHKPKTNTLVAITAAVLLFTHVGEGGAVSVGPDQYDPRRDPNYVREASATTPMNWQAIWSLVREFEGRTDQIVGRGLPSSQFAVPQPSHYVQETPWPGATPSYSGAAVYGGPYGGSFYGYEPWYPSWREASPRIPWWSLIPFKTDHHGHHRQHEARGDHHRW